MKLEKGEIITLDNDKEYIIIDSVSYNSKDYTFLLTVDKPVQILIARQEVVNNEIDLKAVTDSEEAKIVLNIFTKSILKDL